MKTRVMRVLFIFDDEDDEDKELVLSPVEKERFIRYFWTEYTLTG